MKSLNGEGEVTGRTADVSTVTVRAYYFNHTNLTNKN